MSFFKRIERRLVDLLTSASCDVSALCVGSVLLILLDTAVYISASLPASYEAAVLYR